MSKLDGPIGSEAKPLNEADVLKMREQGRAHLHAHRILASTTYVNATHAERLKAFEGVKEYGQATTRSLLTLNGGATLALLAYVGSISKPDLPWASDVIRDLAPSFYYFGGGLVCAAVMSGLAYINLSAYFRSHLDPGDLYDWLRGDEPPTKPRWLAWTTNFTLVASIALAATGLFCFIRGSLIAVDSFGWIGAR